MQFLTTSLRTVLRTILTASFLLGFSSLAHAQSTDFTFDTTPVGKFSPLTMTQNGITATFTDDFGPPHAGFGPYDDGQFAVETSAGGSGYYSSAFSGNDLSSAAGYAGQYHPLVILFSQPMTSISFDFALLGYPAASAPATFSAFDGSTLLETQNLTVTPDPNCFFPEGEVSYSSTQAFNKIVLDADPAPFLVIDNVEVTAAPVPEASSVVSLGLLLALGLGVVTVKSRRSAKTTR